MRIRSDRKPFQRSVPTEGSLAFAAQMSELLNIPFDRDSTEDLSRQLHETMFKELITILKIDAESVQFESGYFFATRAFALRGKDGAPQINIDTTFDYWISTLCLLGAIATFETSDRKQWSNLIEQVDATFHLFDDARQFAQAREGMTPFLINYHHLLNLSEGLARAMLVFTLCHELAHCRLDHLSEPSDKQQELDADRLAAQFFLAVMEHGRHDNHTTVHIDPKVSGAPIIFMHLLNLHEAWQAQQGRSLKASSQHPYALDRLANIEPLLSPIQDDTVRSVINGMIAGIGDIKSALMGDSVQ